MELSTTHFQKIFLCNLQLLQFGAIVVASVVSRMAVTWRHNVPRRQLGQLLERFDLLPSLVSVPSKARHSATAGRCVRIRVARKQNPWLVWGRVANIECNGAR
jgi:hypothetical protein